MAADSKTGETLKVVAVEPLKAGGKWRKPGDEFSVAKADAEELVDAGLVAFPKKATKAPPAPPAGTGQGGAAAPTPAAPPAGNAQGNAQGGDLLGGTPT
jgi:hypothetical protein